MIEEFRKEIDEIDEKIVNLIADRLSVVKQIGDFKRKNNLPVLDKNRFEKVLEKVCNIATKKHISNDFIIKIYEVIHEYSCEVEK